METNCPHTLSVVTLSSENVINISINSESLSTETITVSDDNLYPIENVMTNTHIRKGYSPYVNEETETWWEYDDENKQFIDTGYSVGFKPITKSELTSLWENSILEEE